MAIVPFQAFADSLMEALLIETRTCNARRTLCILSNLRLILDFW